MGELRDDLDEVNGDGEQAKIETMKTAINHSLQESELLPALALDSSFSTQRQGHEDGEEDL